MNAHQRRVARRRGIVIRVCYNCYRMYEDARQVCPECAHPHAKRVTIGDD